MSYSGSLCLLSKYSGPSGGKDCNSNALPWCWTVNQEIILVRILGGLSVSATQFWISSTILTILTNTEEKYFYKLAGKLHKFFLK